MKSAVGFKVRMDPSLVCFLRFTLLQHPDGKHSSRAFLSTYLGCGNLDSLNNRIPYLSFESEIFFVSCEVSISFPFSNLRLISSASVIFFIKISIPIFLISKKGEAFKKINYIILQSRLK